MASWWVVMLPGEYPETSDLFGPFRTEETAKEVAARWNADHPDDKATVLPISPHKEMR